MRLRDTGVVSEMRVASLLISRGYTVSKPLNDDKYDLVIDRDGHFTKIQVKHGRLENGCVRATLCEYSRGESYIYSEEEVDMFAVYNETHGCFFVPFEDAPEQLIHIRVEEPDIDSPHIRYEEDYRIDEQL